MVDEGGGGQQEGRRVRSPSHTFRRRKGRKTVQVLCFFPALLSFGPPTQRTAPPSLLRGMSPCRSPARRHIFYTFPPPNSFKVCETVSVCVPRPTRCFRWTDFPLFLSHVSVSHMSLLDSKPVTGLWGRRHGRTDVTEV